MHRSVVVIIAGCVVAVAVLVTLLFSLQRFTGLASLQAVGGTVGSFNLSVGVDASSWLGVYGSLDGGGESNGSFSSGMVVELNLSYNGPVANVLVVASTVSEPDWTDLSPASLAQVDAFLGLGGGNPFSAENTLLALSNVTIDDTVYELWSATVPSDSSSVTGALVSNGSLLFVTAVSEDMAGYDGSVMDYQLLLPVPLSGMVNYTFFAFVQDELPSSGALSCNSSSLSAVLGSDNVSVELSWDAVAGASSYEVLFVDAVGDWLDFSGAAVVDVGANTSWSDASDPAARFYQVRATTEGASCVLNQTAGRLAEPLSPEYNLFSTPFSAANASVRETLRSAEGKYDNVNEFNNTGKTYRFYLIVGNNVFKNFDDVVPGRGYWLRATQNGTLRLTGTLVDSVTDDVSPNYNLLGFPLINNTAHNRSVSYVLSSINGTYNNVNEFNNTGKTYNYYLIVGNNVFKNFDAITPGKGYWVRTVTNATLDYQNS